MDRFIQGCMRIKDMTTAQIRELIDADLANDINVFDHADIYGGGECESAFGKALKEAPQLRDKIIIQTKGGIVKDLSCHRYDNSANYLIDCVHKSAKRLGVDKIDRFLIHRPDALFNPDETAKAFDKLHSEGLVDEFGVSNFSDCSFERKLQAKNQIQSGASQHIPLSYDRIRYELQQIQRRRRKSRRGYA